MASKCRKFVPNIFNRLKCQTCFGSKEQHSAEALENNKASRKVSKCGYLFVAPGYDFSNPLDKTKRWQRRFFVLYDDGELAYSVDENPDTVPQGVIDMNKCTDVKDASGSTSHSNSLAIITPEKTTYIKGNSKEEIQWWHDVLIVYPRSICKPKQRRFTVPSYSFLNKENLQPKAQPAQEPVEDPKGLEVDKVKPKDQALTYRGVRNMKHTKGNKNYQEGLRKSSSLHDLSTDEKESGNLDQSRFLSLSGDRLDNTEDHSRLLSGYGDNPYVRTPSWKSGGAFSAHDSSSNSLLSSTSASQSSIGGDASGNKRRGSFDNKALQNLKNKNANERARLHRERSASMKSFPTGLTLPKIQSSVGSSSMDRLVTRPEASRDNRAPENGNETDEFKMAKSSEMQSASRTTPPPPSPKGAASTKFEDLMYMKKGWLIKMGTSEKDWKKHWFVLTGNSLRYYKDAKAEESNSLDGRIDLSTCYEISEVEIQRNYGFKIKTRNGEYTLSAMTSGIRSNWMKAIRLCIDLQNSNKNDGKSGTDTAHRTNDDMDIDTSSASGTSSMENGRGLEKKKDSVRNIRRHYSDVNPGKISKMFSIKGLTMDSSTSPSPTSSSSGASSKEPSIERETRQEVSAPLSASQDMSWKPGKYDQVWHGDTTNGIPFRRFVEGSDSHVTAPVTSMESSLKTSDKSDDEERKKRAKSPSAKIKDRSRAKSPKLHSPPPGNDSENSFLYRSTDVDEGDKASFSSEELDFADGVDDDNIHMDTDHNLPSSGAGENVLVGILENEVESLKERLEHTQQELAKSHDSNRDLKTKLQSVVREKDNTGQLQASIDSSYAASAFTLPSPESQQMNVLKRQLKESKDSSQRQKSEIDQLKSKLDMSTSKLTGTEKALSEALKDVKQEKDKFLKVSTEYNKKVRSLENQLREVTSKMEKYHENSLIKDKENRKLDQELKQHLQKLRDHESEIIKLKAVEREFRQMREKFDDTEKVMSRMRKDLKEKDDQFKKMEMDYEVQFENMMQEFTRERDDTEHHIEELKAQLLDASRKSGMSDHVSKDVANLMREKDEIIAQLEEKVIENESKLVELTDELKTDEEENTELHQSIEILQEERDNAVAKIKDMEKTISQSKTQFQRMEKENVSIRKHMDDLRKENTDLSERLDTEKSDRSTLAVDNDGLKTTVKDLESEVHSLHDKLNEVCSSHERQSVSSDGVKSQELLQTFVLATAEMTDVTDSMLEMRKQFESLLSNYKGEKASELNTVAEKLEDVGRKCENISEVLREGATLHDEEGIHLGHSNDFTGELESLKNKNKQISVEAERYKKQIAEVQEKYSKLQAEDSRIKEQFKTVNKKLVNQVEEMNKKIDSMADKAKVNVKKKPTKRKQPSTDPKGVTEEIEEQLVELEDRMVSVEKVLASNDLSRQSADNDNQTETEESEAETEDSEDYLLSEEESEDSDSEFNEDGTVADENESLLGKLNEIKSLFETINSRIKELTNEMPEEDLAASAVTSNVEMELRKTLVNCGDRINDLTARLSDGLELAKTEIPRFSDQTWAFRKCVNKLRTKVEQVSCLAHEHDELNAKDVKALQGKLQHLVEYVAQIDKLGDNDWDIAGKIAKQEMKFQHLLLNKEKAAKKSTLKYEDRLQLYADKMAFEAMILGQMGLLIQRQQVGTIYKDVLLREIHEANLQILELERRIDNTNRELNPTDQEKDIVSSYAAVLAERIVLEGQLATCAMVQNVESSENMEILTALNVNETPTVLAMEIFIRSQVDSTVNEQLQKFADNMDGISNHIVTRALLQGEITHALGVVKQKFKSSNSKEDLSTCVKRERQFAFEEIEGRHKMVLDLVNETEPVLMTTLIQLIEFSQGPASPTLNSVCDHIQNVVQKTIKEYEKNLESPDENTRIRSQHIIAHLHSELDDAIIIFQDEHNCYVQTASPEIDPNVLKFSADALASDLAGLFIQKAVIDGSFAFLCELYERNPAVPVGQMVDKLESGGDNLSELAIALGQILLSEAANKQKVAADIRNATSEDGDEMARSVTDLIGVIPDLEAYPQSFNAYTATLVREAMFQSQLTYTTYKLKMHYHRDLRDIKLKLEAGETVVLPSEISKEAESDIQASLATFEDILNTKYQDECAVLGLLQGEMGNLKAVTGEMGCSKCKTFETKLKQLEKIFEHEVSVAQERQNVHSDVLRQKVNNVILRVDKFLEDNEREKERMKSDYEDRIATLQDEFDLMRVNHEEELEQVRQDIMTAVSAIRASEEDAETQSVDQLKNQNKQLLKMSVMCKELLTELQSNTGGAGKNEDLAEKIQTQLGFIQQIESDPSFTLDASLPLPYPDSPILAPKPQEPPKLDRSLSAETSDETVDKLLERSQHEHEMELLKKEKEEALAEEVKVTRAALDAMRKAYTEDLEQEKDKYRHALKTMFTDDYVEEIRRRHEKENERLSEELKLVTMHYDSKCEDYKLMEDRLQRTKSDYQTHINHLVKSNEHLTELVNTEIENLKTFIQTRTKGQLTGNVSMEEELYDSQIMVRVKDAELQKLRQQVKNLENSLERTTEEQRYTMTQYLQCLKKNQEMQAKMKQELMQPRERRDSAQEEQIAKSARALRRNPSFHQRARSPSPETSPKKDNSSEHHSRDSHRRSRGHLSAKDLKRSKSSPSLPFVFGAKSPATGTSTNQTGTPGVTRRESGKKHGKNQKK